MGLLLTNEVGGVLLLYNRFSPLVVYPQIERIKITGIGMEIELMDFKEFHNELAEKTSTPFN